MKYTSLAVVVTLSSQLSCSDSKKPVVEDKKPLWKASVSSTRFNVADHMIASLEMQISGEPFAELMGRNLEGFDRFAATPDVYTDPESKEEKVDTLGFAMAVESYEYSKQPMNNVSFESGAGLSLMYGPLLNPTGKTGEEGHALLAARIDELAVACNAGGPAGTNFVITPAPSNNPLNHYGWPGFWPQFAEFRSFAPEIEPSVGATRGCSLEGGYGASAAGALPVGDYECGYNSLNLPNRDTQVEKVLSPDALGYSAWKQILWVINYWASLHDKDGNAIVEVADADLAKVGTADNRVIGKMVDPEDPEGKRLIDGAVGTYLAGNSLEGFQGLAMLVEMDEKAALLTSQLVTGDGKTLAGFGSLKEALDYDYKSAPRWWPAAVGVTETATTSDAAMSGRFFPRPTGFSVMSGESRLRDLAGLLGGYASFFALTDEKNAEVGGAVQARTTFDGAPFAADNGKPDGESSPHDRALAILKVALVDLDRLHWDSAAKVLVDSATVEGTTPKLGRQVSTVEASLAIVSLRTALRGLNASLTLYGNDTPDSQGLPTALDETSWGGATYTGTIGAHIVELIRAEADFIADKLTAADDSVANSYDLTAGTRSSDGTTLAAESAAIRGLLEAYLATSDDKYRQKAQRIYGDLEKRFWMETTRAFRTSAGVDDKLTYTPLSFGMLHGALRQYWKLVASRPGQEAVKTTLEQRLVRTFKLVVNGWDDGNGDEKVDFPGECIGAGLQLAERALTGEMSLAEDGADRDHDCVKEIGAAKQPAALAGELVLVPSK